MRPNPEISVIMPVYKGVRFLEESLGSLLGQSFSDWECICVDDGAVDGSGDLVDRMSRDDERLRVIHQANGGTSVARNTGLSAARGRFVAFLDEDDAYAPQFLEVLHDVAQRTDADVVGCDCVHFQEEETPVFGNPPPAESGWRVADRVTVAEWMTRFYYGIPFEVWRNLYRRAFVADHWFVPGVRVEQDLLWHYTLLPRIGKMVLLPWKGYAWRESSQGGYVHPDPDSLASLARSYRLVLDDVAGKMGMTDAQRRTLADSIVTDIDWNIRRHIRGGMSFTRSQSAVLRRDLRLLSSSGADVRQCLPIVERLRWTFFMLTGR